MTIDKKRLREEYKELKPPMGCFAIRCDATGDLFIGWAENLKSARNSLMFRLSIGGLQNFSALQQLYTLHGDEQFSFIVLEDLPYDRDDKFKDYKADLAILAEMYLDKYPEAKEIQVWKYPQHSNTNP